MKHIKIFEDFSEHDDALRLFDLLESIPLGSDFYVEGLKGGDSPSKEDIRGMENIISSFEPRHSYYYQDTNAVQVVYNQTVELNKHYGEKMKNIGWKITCPVLAYFGNGLSGTKFPGSITFWVGDKRIYIDTTGKTSEEIKELGKKTAKENGVTHIGRIGRRIPIIEWDGSPS